MNARPIAELVASLNALTDAWGDNFTLRTRKPPVGEGALVGVRIADGATSPWRDVGLFEPGPDAEALVSLWLAVRSAIDDPTDTVEIPVPQGLPGWSDTGPGVETGSRKAFSVCVERYFFAAGAPRKEILERWVARALAQRAFEVTAEIAVRHVEVHVLGEEGVRDDVTRAVAALGGAPVAR